MKKNILIGPVITEKSMNQAAKGKYTFLVTLDAKKEQIKKIAEKLFNVHVVSIMTVVSKGKTVRTGMRRIEKKFQPIKKAIIEVKSGEKIGLFETVA